MGGGGGAGGPGGGGGGGGKSKQEEEQVSRTDFTGDVRVQAAEDDVAVGELAGLTLANDELADGTHGGGLLPPHGILVLLAGGPGRGADGVEDEVRVLGEQQDEALADGARAAQDTCEGNDWTC